MISRSACSLVRRNSSGSLGVVGSVDALGVAVSRPLFPSLHWLSTSDALVAARRAAIEDVYSP